MDKTHTHREGESSTESMHTAQMLCSELLHVLFVLLQEKLQVDMCCGMLICIFVLAVIQLTDESHCHKRNCVSMLYTSWFWELHVIWPCMGGCCVAMWFWGACFSLLAMTSWVYHGYNNMFSWLEARLSQCGSVFTWKDRESKDKEGGSKDWKLQSEVKHLCFGCWCLKRPDVWVFFGTSVCPVHLVFDLTPHLGCN